MEFNVFYSTFINCFLPIAIACRLSVFPSVTSVNQDHIGGKSWKLIAWTTSPTPSLFVAKRPSTESQGNIGKFWGD